MSLDGAGVVGRGDTSLRVGRVPRCYEFFFFQEAVSRLSFENAQHVHEISGQSTFLANLVPDICFLLFICEKERERENLLINGLFILKKKNEDIFGDDVVKNIWDYLDIYNNIIREKLKLIEILLLAYGWQQWKPSIIGSLMGQSTIIG